MAEDLKLIAKVILDSKDAQASIEQLRVTLEKAREEQRKMIEQFGETSAEAQAASDKVKLLEDSLKFAVDPIAAINDELAFTKQRLEEVNAEFGETSPEAQAVNEQIKQLEGNLTALQNPVQFFQDQLAGAETKLQETVATFGELSPEAKAAADEVQVIKAGLDQVAETKIDQPVLGLKASLGPAEDALVDIVAKFGLTSKEAEEAAKQVAKIKDTIKDAEKLTESFNPDQKFKTLAGAVQGAAGAFTALQGAQAVFGGESEAVAETLAKVQGALALTQGIDSIIAAKDSFTLLGKSAGNALKGIKSGIAATGIGVLLVALGAIVAYWDDIKGLVSGVSSEQEKLNELGEANLKAEEDKLSALDGQEQQLKAQGKSEKEILQLKLAQTDAAIQAAEVNLENAKATKKAQVEAAERNRDILKGLLNFLSLPLTALLGGVDLLTSKLNQAGILSDETFAKIGNLRDRFTTSVAELVFDPKETEKEGDETIAAAEKTLNSLKEKRAGFQNSIASIDKAAADKASADAKKRAEEAKALQDKIDKDAQDRAKRAADRQASIDKLTQENRLAQIKDGEFKERALLDAAYDEKIAAFLKANADEEAALAESLKNKLIDQSQYELALKKLKAQSDEERAQLDLQYNQQTKAITDKFAKERKDKADKDAADLKATELNRFNDNLKAIEEQIKNDDLAFQTRKESLDNQQGLIDEAFAKGLISEDEYNKKLQENADSRKAIAEAEVNVRLAQAKQIGDIVNGLSELIGKNTKTGKKVAIAGLVIQQAQTVAQVTTDTIRSTKAISAKYAGVPGGQIPAAVEIGINVAQGALAVAKAVKAVKQGIADINAASSSGAGGSAAADVNVGTPPIPPQPQTTTIDQGQVDQIGSATSTVRAYVVEQEVSDSQERLSRLERAARIA